MKIEKENRKIRIAEDQLDPAYLMAGNDDRYFSPYKDLPVFYIVAVQVKVCGFWVNIWRATVDLSDGDGRTIVMNKAKEIVQNLEDSI